jgi:hypothetical protein
VVRGEGNRTGVESGRDGNSESAAAIAALTVTKAPQRRHLWLSTKIVMTRAAADAIDQRRLECMPFSPMAGTRFPGRLFHKIAAHE